MRSRAVERDAQTLLTLPTKEEEAVTRLPLFDGGMRTDKAPYDIATNECSNVEGLHIVAGRLVVDTGYVPFDKGYLGQAQKVFQTKLTDGTIVLLLITTKTVYHWVSEEGQWQLASWGDQAYETTAETLMGDEFDLDTVVGLVVGDLVGLEMDNGEQHISVISDITGLTVTVEDALPAGRSVPLGAIFTLATALEGNSAQKQVSIKVFTGNGWIIFSNGIDPVMYYYQGIVKVLSGLPADTSCNTIEVFHELVLLGGTTEGGVAFPYRVRQSDAGDPEGWEPGVNGIAAIYNLLDTDDPILSLNVLGPWVLLYREASILRGSYIGILNQIIFWEYMIQTEGAQSSGAVVDVGSRHVFVGKAGIYVYDGGYKLEDIGEAIFANLLAPTGDLDEQAKLGIFTVYVVELDEVWVFYPTVGSAVPNKMLRVRLRNKAWSVREFAEPVVGAGYFVSDRVTWASAAGRWSDALWARPWSSKSLVQNIPSILLCPAELGEDGAHLLLYDYSSTTDNGEAIAWTLTTREFGDGSEFMRWETAILLCKGGDVLVEMSEDEGESWTPLYSNMITWAQATGAWTVGQWAQSWASKRVTETETVGLLEVFVDHVSTRLMLRMSGDDPSFTLRRMAVRSIRETEW